jgi:hypothetical protein
MLKLAVNDCPRWLKARRITEVQIASYYNNRIQIATMGILVLGSLVFWITEIQITPHSRRVSLGVHVSLISLLLKDTPALTAVVSTAMDAKFPIHSPHTRYGASGPIYGARRPTWQSIARVSLSPFSSPYFPSPPGHYTHNQIFQAIYICYVFFNLLLFLVLCC